MSFSLPSEENIFMLEIFTDLLDPKQGTILIQLAFATLAEESLKLKDENTYKIYMSKVNAVKSKFFENLEIHKKNTNFSAIFGVGAAAKANTLLTYFGLNNKSIDFIVDSSPFKQNKVTPVSLIPIKNDETLAEISNGLGIVLAWNLGTNLKNKLLTINKNIKFLDIE